MSCMSTYTIQKVGLTTNFWKIYKIIAKLCIMWKNWSMINLEPFGERSEVFLLSHFTKKWKFKGKNTFVDIASEQVRVEFFFIFLSFFICSNSFHQSCAKKWAPPIFDTYHDYTIDPPYFASIYIFSYSVKQSLT